MGSSDADVVQSAVVTIQFDPALSLEPRYPQVREVDQPRLSRDELTCGRGAIGKYVPEGPLCRCLAGSRCGDATGVAVVIAEPSQGSVAAVADLLGGDSSPCAEGECGRAMVLLAFCRLKMLDDPGVEVRPAVAQTATHLHRAWSEPHPTGPPRVQRRLRNREVGRSFVDGENAALPIGIRGGTHRVLLRHDEDRFALVTEGVQRPPRALWRTLAQARPWSAAGPAARQSKFAQIHITSLRRRRTAWIEWRQVDSPRSTLCADTQTRSAGRCGSRSRPATGPIRSPDSQPKLVLAWARPVGDRLGQLDAARTRII